MRACLSEIAPSSSLDNEHAVEVLVLLLSGNLAGNLAGNLGINEIAMCVRIRETVQATLAGSRCCWKTLAGLGVLLDSCSETVQETLARHALHAETLAGLSVVLGSCFRRNDEYWFLAQSLPACAGTCFARVTNIGFYHCLP